MGAFTGRDVLVEFAIADENALPAGLVYKRLGMMRGKSMKTSWDTADTTADQSPQFTKTALVTFKSMEFSGDGVSYTDALYNQSEFKVNTISLGIATANQPKAWLRMTDPVAQRLARGADGIGRMQIHAALGLVAQRSLALEVQLRGVLDVEHHVVGAHALHAAVPVRLQQRLPVAARIAQEKR